MAAENQAREFRERLERINASAKRNRANVAAADGATSDAPAAAVSTADFSASDSSVGDATRANTASTNTVANPASRSISESLPFDGENADLDAVLLSDGPPVASRRRRGPSPLAILVAVLVGAALILFLRMAKFAIINVPASDFGLLQRAVFVLSDTGMALFLGVVVLFMLRKRAKRLVMAFALGYGVMFIAEPQFARIFPNVWADFYSPGYANFLSRKAEYQTANMQFYMSERILPDVIPPDWESREWSIKDLLALDGALREFFDK